MHDIYRHAHLAIIAASAESAREGFLLPERPSQASEAVLPFICPPPPTFVGFQHDGSVAQLKLGQVHIDSIRSASKPYCDELGVMSTRAWCIQEYLLSPRALIFTPTRLLFSYRTSIQGVGNSFGAIQDEPRLPDTLFLRDLPVVERGSKEWKNTNEAWTTVVVDYSRHRASVESDKLVACAAVAQQFSRVLKSDYLAGFWRSGTLLTDLLWEATQTGLHPPSAHCASSWPGVEVEGTVLHNSMSVFSPEIHDSLGVQDPPEIHEFLGAHESLDIHDPLGVHDPLLWASMILCT